MIDILFLIRYCLSMIRYNHNKINLKSKIASGGSLCLISRAPRGIFILKRKYEHWICKII